MSDQSVAPDKVSQGSAVHIGSRGGMYVRDSEKKSSSSKQPSPFKTAKGPGYEILIFREAGRYKVYYKGPNAESKIDELRKLMKDHSLSEALRMIRD